MPIRAWHNWLNDNSALYTVANMQWAETQVALGLTESYTDYLKRRLGDPNGPDAARDDGLATSVDRALPKTPTSRSASCLFPDTAGPMDTDLCVWIPARPRAGDLRQHAIDVHRPAAGLCGDQGSTVALGEPARSSSERESKCDCGGKNPGDVLRTVGGVTRTMTPPVLA